MTDIRVLIIANDPLARAGLAALIAEQPGFTVVGRAAGDVQLSSEIDIYHADAAVWDLGWEWLSEDGGAHLDTTPLAEVIETGLPLTVLAPNESITATLWGLGVRSILLRESRPEQIGAAITAMLQGLITLDAGIAERMIQATPPVEMPSIDALTGRELEVLRAIAEGYSNKAIAQSLSISEHTVKFHINSLMSKLNAQSRTEAVVRATRLGLISL